MVRFALATLLITLTAGPALAGPDETDDTDDTELMSEEAGPRVVYDKRTELDMGELRVDSVIKKPLGAGVVGRRTTTFNPLISLKLEFEREMIDSVNQIR